MSGVTKYKVGDEFPNRKRLVRYVGSHPKFRTSLWEWECMDCGRKFGPSMTNSITRPKKPACCYQNPKGEKAPRWLGYKSITGSFLHSYEYNAKKRGFEWSVTAEDLWDLYEKQDRRCVYSGFNLTHGRDASIDRIDSLKGYTIDNIQWVHRDINRLKNNFDEATFIRLCHMVAETTDRSWN